jgi:hypothetical protein
MGRRLRQRTNASRQVWWPRTGARLRGDRSRATSARGQRLQIDMLTWWRRTASHIRPLMLVFSAGCASILGADFDRPAGTDAGAGGSSCPGADVTCAGKCGQILDACSHLVDCGGCNVGQDCGGGGAPNVCGAGQCTPSCNVKACGTSDGCSRVCTDGFCEGGQRWPMRCSVLARRSRGWGRRT